MSDTKTPLRARLLSSISKKFVEDRDLRDTPARLYRAILNSIDMNPQRWNQYLRDFLNWTITTKDRERAKTDRTTAQGNIKESYFQKPTLTFNKLLEGLAILQMDKCKITLEVTDKDGKVVTVSETIRIMNPANSPGPKQD